MTQKEIREWVRNITEAVQDDYDAYDNLFEFFGAFDLEKEFDRAWQFGVFDSWTMNPTQKELLRLVKVVERGMY